MQKVFLALAALGLVFGFALAGAVYTNNTGKVASGFRIEFASPVTITSHAPAFPQQEPQGRATAFTFSGGSVPPGGSFWLSWQPGTVRVTSHSWLTSELLSQAKGSESTPPK